MLWCACTCVCTCVCVSSPHRNEGAFLSKHRVQTCSQSFPSLLQQPGADVPAGRWGTMTSTSTPPPRPRPVQGWYRFRWYHTAGSVGAPGTRNQALRSTCRPELWRADCKKTHRNKNKSGLKSEPATTPPRRARAHTRGACARRAPQVRRTLTSPPRPDFDSSPARFCAAFRNQHQPKKAQQSSVNPESC